MSAAEIPSVGGTIPDAFSSTGTTPAAQPAAGGFSGIKRMRPEQRLAAAHAMRDLMQERDITVLEAGAALGISATNSWKLAALIGLKASPTALYRLRLSIVRAITPEQAALGRKKSTEALREYRERTRAEAAARRREAAAAKKERARPRSDQQRNCGAKRWRAELEARRVARAEIANSLRGYIARHQCTVSEAARAIGISEGRGHSIAAEFGIKAPRQVVLARASVTGKQGSARKAEQPRAPISAPNPKLSPAQQAHVDRYRMAGKGLIAAKCMYVPPPPNADDLIRQALAEGRVTVCPPRFANPINNGTGR